MNIAFFGFYYLIGALNPVDIFVLVVLMVLISAASFTIKKLYLSFSEYYTGDIKIRQKEYHDFVTELDVVNRKGRKIENELTRISRLYEITKTLAPALKLEDLLNLFFSFLENNFSFQAAHLVTFSEGKFSKGISKRVGVDGFNQDSDKNLEYKKVIAYLSKREFKPIFISKEEQPEVLKKFNIDSESFLIFPLFLDKRLFAILAIEGATRSSYSRFKIFISQITLQFRKVELYEKVQKLSIIDGLTEVYLRRYLMDRLEEEVERAGRLGLTFSVGMVDVDHFKECNDKHGHLVGDVVLKEIALRLKKSVREVDMISRYGGEEFCVVLPETPKELAIMVSERLRNSICSKKIKAFDEEIKITTSIGVATYPEDGTDVATLIEKADMALYKAKRQGRNLVRSA